MADERDPKFSRHYRELEPLEPPPELDRKILDAARAPLVTPAWRHRWYYGLAAAAVLVFAVALTLHIERERPDQEGAIASAPLRLDRELRGQIKAAPTEPKEEAKPPVAFAPDPQPTQSDAVAESSRDAAHAPEQARAAPARPARGDALRLSRDRSAGERTAAASEAAQAEAMAAAARASAERGVASQRSAAAPMAAAAPAAVPEKPEPWLERIAEMRSRGRHAEADRELAAFRNAYPNYQLSDLMRERVEGIPTPSR
jgi:hypothetical protein